LYTYYRRFTAGLADIAKPLSQLMEEKWTFQWHPETEAAFQSLKVSFCMAPMLRYPQLGEKFAVNLYASNMGTEVCCHKNILHAPIQR
jgi:hypothetical protein